MDVTLFLEKFRFSSLDQQQDHLSVFEQNPQNRETLLDWMNEAVEALNVNDGDGILTGFYLFAHLKEQRAFPIIRNLMNRDIEKVEECLGDFIFFDATCLMACFLDQGEELYEIIENSLIDCLWKTAALEALVQLVGKGSLSRSTAVDYLKKLLRALLDNSSVDELLSHVVAICCKLHPIEVAEEIREAFARDIIDPLIVNIEDFNADLQIPLSKIQEFLQQEALDQLPPLETLQAYFEKPDFEVEEEIDPPIEITGRNDPCPCGSEKKYKKCCLFSKNEQNQKIRLVNMKISSNPMQDELYPCTLFPEDQQLLEELYFKMKNDPKKSLEQLLTLKEIYPNHPPLYNYIYVCYTLSDEPEKAMAVLRETLKLFPRYLFGLLEYGRYLLKCEEYEQFSSLFDHRYNLIDLYPERDTFHMSEVKSFTFVMGKYFAEIGDLKQANIYLDCLKQLLPDEEETYDLEDLISYSLL